MVVEVAPVDFVVTQNSLDLSHFISDFLDDCIDNWLESVGQISYVVMYLSFLLVAFDQFF